MTPKYVEEIAANIHQIIRAPVRNHQKQNQEVRIKDTKVKDNEEVDESNPMASETMKSPRKIFL